jgi:hypothetical protein
MTFKQLSLQSLLAAVFAISAALIYNSVYSSAFMVDFSAVMNSGAIISATLIGIILIGISHLVAHKWLKGKGLGIINLLICVLSFASIIGIFAMKFPLEIEFPELFPGLAVPMHFFPALAFFAVQPFFVKR